MFWLPILVFLGASDPLLANNYPLFDIATLMRMLLVPANTAVGTPIYRLRARDSEHDYPLAFEVVGNSIVHIENLACPRNRSFCEANVILSRPLEVGRLYDLKASVQDTQGHTTAISCTIKATNGSTKVSDIFPHRPALIMVPEDTRPGTALEYVIARKNPQNSRHVSLELKGSPEFHIEQTLASSDMVNGTIFLKSELDFELKSMYTLTVYAMDPYAEPGNDTRNLASFQVAVAVVDVQDTAPVFTLAPPITKINGSFEEGDTVLSVKAEDGDRGSPREIRYGFVSEGNPFTTYFHIDDRTGDVTLARPLKDLSTITAVNQPIILQIAAQEVKTSINEPPGLATTVQVALLLGELGNTPPYFENSHYVARVAENSPQGTALQFEDPYITEVRDDNMGKNGVFSLSLENNNGTFEVTPSVAERRVSFVILVRNNNLLDYEARQNLQFTITAREVGPGGPSLSSSAEVAVYIDDVNDNPPVFVEKGYEADLPENVTAGTRVTQVHAEDFDTGLSGRVQYTGILGHLNTSLTLDPITGVITIATNNHKFDREAASEFRFLVEARDMEGVGNRATVPLLLRLMDVNDETPRFERPLYEFILTPDLRNFTVRAFIKALDKDAEPPNNEVRYEIMNGNYDDKFYLDGVTGELTLKQQLAPARMRMGRTKRESGMESVIGLTVRAYDLGVPHRWSHASVRVYPPETRARTMRFIVSGSRPDITRTEEELGALTGGRVHIKEVLPFTADNHLSAARDEDKSVVVATVLYDGSSVVDVSQLHQNMHHKNQTAAPVTEYRAENRVLFWILMFLAVLIVLIILLLLMCCICPCCPLYVAPKSRSQIHSEEDMHLVVKEKGPGVESKSVQAGLNGPREAWSADLRQQQWRFNRRNARPVEMGTDFADEERRIYVTDDRRSINSLPAHQSLRLRDGPALVYTREVQDRDRTLRFTRSNRDVYLEDYEDVEFPTVRLLHPRDIRNAGGRHQSEEDPDTDSMRRHEVERGSDVGYRRREDLQMDLSTAAAARRDQFYVREGNAEILRLMTRGRQEDILVNQEATTTARPMTLVPRQQGKDMIMRRFMEDQRNNTTENNVGSSHHDQDSLTETNQMTSQQLQELLLKRLMEEEARHQETQSLPGQATMATQTDKDSSTQTDPPRRRAHSENGSYSEEDPEDYGDDSSYRTGHWIRRYHGNRRSKRFRFRDGSLRGGGVTKRGALGVVRRHKIKTPILEETESALDAAERKEDAGVASRYADNKSSMLRRGLAREKYVTTSGDVDEATPPDSLEDQPEDRVARHSASMKDLRFEGREVDDAPGEERGYITSQRRGSDTIPGHKFWDSDPQDRNFSSILKNSYNELNSRRNSIGETIVQRRQSTSDMKKRKAHGGIAAGGKALSKSTSTLEVKRKPKTTSRYMEWYKTKRELRQKLTGETTSKKDDDAAAARSSSRISDVEIVNEFQNLDPVYREKITRNLRHVKPPRLVSSRSDVRHGETDARHFAKQEKQSFFSRGRERIKSIGDQISGRVLGVPSYDDDDSGIAMSSLLAGGKKKKNHQLLEKKSVFTIAYDDMQTQQIRPDSSSPPF